MFEKIAHQNVLITGASAGIGHSTALIFAEYGANVIISARRADRLDEIEKQINEKHPNVNVHSSVMDVSNEDSVKAGFAAFPEWAKRIDILINNAGLAQGANQIKDLKTSDMDAMLNTNVKSLVWVSQHVIPQMLERDTGTIINIGSVAGYNPRPTNGMYAATKFALDAITQTMQMETNDSNVRVIQVRPGIVKSEFSLVRNYGNKKASDDFYNTVPFITPEEVAETVLFAASRDQQCVISDVTVVPNGQVRTLALRTRKPSI